MNVLLINPPNENEMRGPHPMKADDMAVFPHLGLMYVASYMNKMGGFNVNLLDMALERASLSRLAGLIRESKPFVIGLTSYTDTLYDLKMTIESIRKEAPDIFIVIGGPHAEIYPEETLSAFPVNCIIKGDGEKSFYELCLRLQGGKNWRDVGGVGFKEDGTIKLNAPWQVENLDDLPFPSRELSTMERIRSAVASGSALASVCSSRGCPLPCTFCNSPYKKHRLRSPNSVLEEMLECKNRWGIDEFYFFDDLFNISKQRVLDVCDAFEKYKLDVKWSFRGRVNNLDEEALKRCLDSGCNRIHFGVEAGTERILKIYKKGLKLDNVRRVFEICDRLGIETVANFMIGAPTETREEIRQTLKFVSEISPTYLELHVVIPYPYTPIYQKMLADGDLATDVWREHAVDPKPNFHPPLCNKLIPEKELFAILNEAYRKYYFRPSYIMREIKKVTSLKDLMNKAHGAMRLLTVTRT